MSISIRPATLADIQTIFALVHELADYERLSDEMIATEQDLREAFFGETPRVFCDLAEYNGQIAGYTVWFYSYSTFRGRHGIWMEDVFVRPEFRGKGLGKALLAHLARTCVSENLARLEWSVLDWNEPSIVFYKTIGARLMQEWMNCRLTGAPLWQLADDARSKA